MSRHALPPEPDPKPRGALQVHVTHVQLNSHDVRLRLDDETWRAFEAKAAGRGETTGDLVVYAMEQFLEREGFVPDWALRPLAARACEGR